MFLALAMCECWVFCTINAKVQFMKILEVTTPATTKTPEQQRIATLTKQKQVAADALKAERNRQKIQRAQQQIRTAKQSQTLVS